MKLSSNRSKLEVNVCKTDVQWTWDQPHIREIGNIEKWWMFMRWMKVKGRGGIRRGDWERPPSTLDQTFSLKYYLIELESFSITSRPSSKSPILSSGDRLYLAVPCDEVRIHTQYAPGKLESNYQVSPNVSPQPLESLVVATMTKTSNQPLDASLNLLHVADRPEYHNQGRTNAPYVGRLPIANVFARGQLLWS